MESGDNLSKNYAFSQKHCRSLSKEALLECRSRAGLVIASLVLRFTREFLETVWGEKMCRIAGEKRSFQ